MMRILLALAALLAACSQPAPRPPIVDSGLKDLFTGKVFNCRLDVVAVERDSAMVTVKGCLVEDSPYTPAAPCLVKQTGQYKADTVACVARDLGASANAAVNAGVATPDERLMAVAAREWVRNERLGYK